MSPLKMIWRHDIIHLILLGRNDFSALVKLRPVRHIEYWTVTQMSQKGPNTITLLLPSHISQQAFPFQKLAKHNTSSLDVQIIIEHTDWSNVGWLKPRKLSTYYNFMHEIEKNWKVHICSIKGAAMSFMHIIITSAHFWHYYIKRFFISMVSTENEHFYLIG